MTETELYLCGAAVLFAFGIAFFLTPWAKKFACRVGAVDVPKDNRRMHAFPIPRLGGVAVAIAFFAGCAAFPIEKELVRILASGGVCLCALGMADDIHALSPLWKLAGQSVCAWMAVQNGATIVQFSLFGRMVKCGMWGDVFAFFWILALINAINLIDGLDSLCGGVCAIASLALWLITVTLSANDDALALALLLGACLGFLPYNRHPADIFIGDTGAMFLGYALAILSLDGLFQSHLLTAFSVSILLFAFPLLDTVFAFLRRILHAQNPFQADFRHLHHRLIAKGCTQKQAVRILFLLCAMGAAGALLLTSLRFYAVGICAIAVLWCAFCKLYFRLPKAEKKAENSPPLTEKKG